MMMKHPNMKKYISQDDLKVARRWQLGVVALYGSIIVALIFLSSAFNEEPFRTAGQAAQTTEAAASRLGTRSATVARDQTAATAPQRTN